MDKQYKVVDILQGDAYYTDRFDYIGHTFYCDGITEKGYCHPYGWDNPKIKAGCFARVVAEELPELQIYQITDINPGDAFRGSRECLIGKSFVGVQDCPKGYEVHEWIHKDDHTEYVSCFHSIETRELKAYKLLGLGFDSWAGDIDTYRNEIFLAEESPVGPAYYVTDWLNFDINHAPGIFADAMAERVSPEDVLLAMAPVPEPIREPAPRDIVKVKFTEDTSWSNEEFYSDLFMVGLDLELNTGMKGYSGTLIPVHPQDMHTDLSEGQCKIFSCSFEATVVDV